MTKLLIVLSMSICLAFLVSVVAADHFVYRAADPAVQNLVETGDVNGVYISWGLSPGNMFWWADSTIQSDVTTVINNWTSAIPELVWTPGFSEEDSDVVFKWTTCPPPKATEAACVTFDSYYFDNIRTGEYWTSATIYINPNEPWSVEGRKGAISHLVGTLYGLRQRGIEDIPACTLAETTMDGLFFDPLFGETFHCDGSVGPEVADDTLATDFWSTGDAKRVTAVAVGNTGVLPVEGRYLCSVSLGRSMAALA